MIVASRCISAAAACELGNVMAGFAEDLSFGMGTHPQGCFKTTRTLNYGWGKLQSAGFQVITAPIVHNSTPPPKPQDHRRHLVDGCVSIAIFFASKPLSFSFCRYCCGDRRGRRRRRRRRLIVVVPPLPLLPAHFPHSQSASTSLLGFHRPSLKGKLRTPRQLDHRHNKPMPCFFLKV
jgi:hypothetical protein